MKYTGNIKENLAKMRDYFVNVLNFECIEGESLYDDSPNECELFLIKRDVGLRISIVKHYDDDEIDFTMNGRPNEAEKYYDYIDYFLVPSDSNLCDIKIRHEIDNYFKG